jgi:hypothetical protein
VHTPRILRCNSSSAVEPEILSFALILDLADCSDYQNIKVMPRLFITFASCFLFLKLPPCHPFVLPSLFHTCLLCRCQMPLDQLHLTTHRFESFQVPTAMPMTSRPPSFSSFTTLSTPLRRSFLTSVPPPLANQHCARVPRPLEGFLLCSCLGHRRAQYLLNSPFLF